MRMVVCMHVYAHASTHADLPVIGEVEQARVVVVVGVIFIHVRMPVHVVGGPRLPVSVANLPSGCQERRHSPRTEVGREKTSTILVGARLDLPISKYVSFLPYILADAYIYIHEYALTHTHIDAHAHAGTSRVTKVGAVK